MCAIKRSPTRDSFITASVYAEKYGIGENQARRLFSRGRIDGYVLGGDGTPGFGRLFIKDEPVFATRSEHRYRDGKKRCPSCLSWLDSSLFSPSEFKRTSGPCQMCARLGANGGKKTKCRIEMLISSNNKAAELEKQYVLSDQQRAEREDQIEAHANRIKAMGLQGDGEEWVPMRSCRSCKECLPEGEFSVEKKGQGGLRRVCKPCKRAAYNAAYAKSKAMGLQGDGEGWADGEGS